MSAADHIKFDTASVFSDPRIKIWRSLPDRENGTLDFIDANGSAIRLHVKRYPAGHGAMADREVAGFALLAEKKIPSAKIVAHSQPGEQRGFVILQDLAGYTPVDKLIEQGFPFERLISATAHLAAQLHEARLHHRDLYLCHFMLRDEAGTIDAKLIDMARVAQMKNPLTRQRWIVKDLAQFWFSTTKLPITDHQRDYWLHQYAEKRHISAKSLQAAVVRKAQAIARHDVELNRRQPKRNVSIPAKQN